METGRQYRRVNPPQITPDGFDVGFAPVRLRLSLAFEWSGFDQNPPLLFFNDPARVFLGLGMIRWTKLFNIGLTRFSCVIEQSIVEAFPGFLVTATISDDLGGSLVLTWPQVVYKPWWTENIALWTIYPHTEDATGLFGVSVGFGVHAIQYSEEP